MNIPPFAQKIFQKFLFFRHIRLTHMSVLIYGTAILAIFIIAVLGWDTYLFMQSITPLQTMEIQETKKISLTAEDIKEAIRILDQRQEKFAALLKMTNASTTISF